LSGQAVISGGYDLRLLSESGYPEQYAFQTLQVTGQGPNSAGDGWTVRVVNYGTLPASLEVTAVCFGQAPAN